MPHSYNNQLANIHSNSVFILLMGTAIWTNIFNIFNSVLIILKTCEKERMHVIIIIVPLSYLYSLNASVLLIPPANSLFSSFAWDTFLCLNLLSYFIRIFIVLFTSFNDLKTFIYIECLTLLTKLNYLFLANCKGLMYLVTHSRGSVTICLSTKMVSFLLICSLTGSH